MRTLKLFLNATALGSFVGSVATIWQLNDAVEILVSIVLFEAIESALGIWVFPKIKKCILALKEVKTNE